jgi:hypothetical protein
VTPELFTAALWACLGGAVIGLIWALFALYLTIAIFIDHNPPLRPFARWPTTDEIRNVITELAPIIGLLSAFCLTILVALAWLQGVSQ